MIARKLRSWSARQKVVIALISLILLSAAIIVPLLHAHNGPTSTPTAMQLTVSLTARPTATPRPSPTPTPTPSPTPTPTATPTPVLLQPTPVAASQLPPGSALPSESQCAASITRSSFEPRPQNAAANQRVPTASQLAGLDPKQNPYAPQISGNFVGTTDEILQWVACKWGMDPDIVRAQAVVESYWVQSTQGGATTDQTICAPGTWDGKACYQYFGLLQLTYQYWKSAWPMMRDDTAFGAEYVYGLIRRCYDGQAQYNNTPAPGYPRYHAGDIWGCMGAWYSGQWYPQSAMDYINAVKKYYTNKIWLQKGF